MLNIKIDIFKIAIVCTVALMNLDERLLKVNQKSKHYVVSKITKITSYKKILNKHVDYETCSCRSVRFLGMLFCDDITIFWDDNLLLFTFLAGKLRKKLFWTNQKFVYLLSSKNFVPK